MFIWSQEVKACQMLPATQVLETRGLCLVSKRRGQQSFVEIPHSPYCSSNLLGPPTVTKPLNAPFVSLIAFNISLQAQGQGHLCRRP